MKESRKLILLYHKINDTSLDYNRIAVSKANFEQHMKFLSDNYNVLSLDDLLDYEGDLTSISVTFDD